MQFAGLPEPAGSRVPGAEGDKKNLLKVAGIVVLALAVVAGAGALYIHVDGIPRYAPPHIPSIQVAVAPERVARGCELVLRTGLMPDGRYLPPWMHPEKTPGYMSGGNEMRDPDGHSIVSANIAPDAETGLCEWSEDEFVRAVRSGFRPDGRVLRPPMEPWLALGDDEGRAPAFGIPRARAGGPQGGKSMLKVLVLCVALAAAGAVGGCVRESPPPAYPDLVYVEPGVYVLADVGPPVYFVDGVYWWYDDDVWVWSDHDRGAWHRGRPAPHRLRAIHDPGAYAARARDSGRHIRADQVPRPASGVEPRGGRRSSPPAHRPANAHPHERWHRERR